MPGTKRPKSTDSTTSTGSARSTRSGVTVVHQITVGQTLVERVEGHAARTESTEFKHARAALQKIMRTIDANEFGPGPFEAHHGGSIWVKADDGWRLMLNWAGIEWSAQFCCDPARVERLRQNAAAITRGFPQTLPALEALDYQDIDILSTPVTGTDEIKRYVDSIWNACVPIPQPRHTGSLKPADPLAAGVHTYPEPMCGIPRVMRSDFVPFVVDPDTHTAVVVAPVAPRFSGDGRVRVMYAERGNPLHELKARAHTEGGALVLEPDHPVARAAFADQQDE